MHSAGLLNLLEFVREIVALSDTSSHQPTQGEERYALPVFENRQGRRTDFFRRSVSRVHCRIRADDHEWERGEALYGPDCFAQ
jgi:hypothetical protein